MKHEDIQTLLPYYASGQISEAESAFVKDHLSSCEDCQADLLLWRAVSGEIRRTDSVITASPTLPKRALEQIHAPNRLSSSFRSAWHLLRAQAFLVQREMWPSAALVMVMGVLVALISDKANFLFFISPLIASSMVAMIYGPDNDPALELCLATQTSPWKILLARLSLVSSYNLLLSFIASVVMLFIIPPGFLGTLILGWLGPLTFLSALALLLSIWFGTSQAITITYSLWLLQYIPFKAMGIWFNTAGLNSTMIAYQHFWQSPMLLLPPSLLLLGLAMWSVNHSAFKFTKSIK